MSIMKKELLIIAAGGLWGTLVQHAQGSDMGPVADRLHARVSNLEPGCWPDLSREINKSTDDRTRLPQDLLIRMAAVGAGMGELPLQAEMVCMLYGTPFWNEAGRHWLEEVLASKDIAIITSLQRFFSNKYESTIRARIQARLKELAPPPPPPPVVQATPEKPQTPNVRMVGVLRADWVEDVVMNRMEFVSPRRASVQALSDIFDDYIEEFGASVGTGKRRTKLQLLQEIKADINEYSPRAMKLLSVGVHPSRPIIEMNVAYVYKADKKRAARSGAKDKSGYMKIIFMLNDKGKVVSMRTDEYKTEDTKPTLSSGFEPYLYSGEHTVISE